MAAMSLWRVLFALNAVLLVFLVFALPFQRAGTGSWVISVVSFGIIGCSLLGLGALLRFEWEPF